MSKQHHHTMGLRCMPSTAVNIGADDYTAEFWELTKRETLPLVARVIEESGGESESGLFRTVRRELRRLPNGDYMLIVDGKSWSRLTFDEGLIADYHARCRIWGHRYDPELLDTLVALEREGAPNGLCYTWLGGTAGLHDVEITGCVQCFGGGRSSTAIEKLAHLHEYLEQYHWTPDEPTRRLIERASELAVPGSIQVIPRTDGL